MEEGLEGVWRGFGGGFGGSLEGFPGRDRGVPIRQHRSEPGPAGRGKGGFPSLLWLEIGGTEDLGGTEAQSLPSTRLEARGLSGLREITNVCLKAKTSSTAIIFLPEFQFE